jgi:pyruvate/2-oxoglutarate dehydrogenase complex dihydrolipoamide acyltransferase (E2) component
LPINPVFVMMKKAFTFQNIPRTRLATFDTYAVGMEKHHVAAMLEFEVTESREKMRALKKKGKKISFNAWLIKVIGDVLSEHPQATAFLYSRRKLIVFGDIDISILVEKQSGNQKVPIPMVIEKVNEKSVEQITAEIEQAKSGNLAEKDVVLNRRSSRVENFYYHLPGFIRRAVWRWMLASPKFVYGKMGNAVVTSVGMLGKIQGWFLHTSVHPISFGIGSVLKKPWVVGDEIMVREILNMTILVDHDVIDGGPMVRMLNDLTKRIEEGAALDADYE